MLLNPIVIRDKSGDEIGLACTLRKAMRLRRRAAGIEPPFNGHPTKKNTPGRLRHFEAESKRALNAKLRFDRIWELLMFSANKKKVK